MQAGRDRITTPVGSRGRCRPEGGQQYQAKSANSEIKQAAEEGPGLWVAASEVAEKVSRFVGRAFRHDIKSAFPSGVLTPEGFNTLFQRHATLSHLSSTAVRCCPKLIRPLRWQPTERPDGVPTKAARQDAQYKWRSLLRRPAGPEKRSRLSEII